jgi:nitrite reductase/ring-hydroxylating ferredoxin subunit
MGQFIKVAKVSDFRPGEGDVIEAGGATIALFNVKRQFYAIDNTCPHRQGPLAYGEMIDEDIFCPIHRAQFNIPTGKCVGPKDKPWYPEMENVSTYQVRINGDDIEIEV